MVIISITLATAYALSTMEGTTQQIQQNSSSRVQARQAALAGMSIALRRMHQEDWIGCDKSLSGKLTATERYEVTYETGDPALKRDDPDFSFWPLRVTIRSTGYSSSEQNASAAIYRVRTVVQLVPIRLNDTPRDWSEIVPQLDPITGEISGSIQPPTIHQTRSGEVALDPPIRIAGPVRLRGRLELGNKYKWSRDIRKRFFEDLQKMHLQGLDYRPFTGPIYLPHNQQQTETLSLLASMRIPTNDASPASIPANASFKLIGSYRLYPGGKLYLVPTCSSMLSNTPLTADPQTNPLGLFAATGDVQLQSNVTLEGTLVSQGSILLSGTNIEAKPLALPALYGTSEPVELPVLMSLDDLQVANGAQATVEGLVGVARKLQVRRGNSSTSFNLTGQVLLNDLQIEVRTDWDLSGSRWGSLLSDCNLLNPLFLLLKNLLHLQHFPLYLKDKQGLDPEPKIVFRPRTTAVRYHWLLDGQSLYLPAAGDPGLRWDIVRWEDGVE